MKKLVLQLLFVSAFIGAQLNALTPVKSVTISNPTSLNLFVGKNGEKANVALTPLNKNSSIQVSPYSCYIIYPSNNPNGSGVLLDCSTPESLWIATTDRVVNGVAISTSHFKEINGTTATIQTSNNRFGFTIVGQ